MDKITAKALLEKYKQGLCNEDELSILESWYMAEPLAETNFSVEELNERKNKIWETLPVHQYSKTKKLWPTYQIAAAAILLICTSFGLYFFLGRNQQAMPVDQEIATILPGGKKAILKLADGTSISLNDANNGKIVDQAGASVVKTANGELTYNPNAEGTNQVQINTLIIPKGGYYTLTLADGTKVWLNSASSLKYPTAFVGNERIVELTGEGYFEVAHNANQPFKVVTDRQTVQVLGTHFNINTYDDEPTIATTLLQGSVKVTANNAPAKFLKPGQQANLGSNSFTVKEVDAADEIAWTTNSFLFNDEDLGSIMRKISRWYDVEVVCSDKLANLTFSGSISRSKNIHQVLKIMQLTETIHFKFEGRRITVMP